MGKALVRVDWQRTELMDFHRLFHFQGNLKDLSEENYKKLKAVILRLGFSEPISVWEHENENKILNGHQRLRTLLSMEKEGYTIPLIPVNFILAKDEKEARQKVLALTSQYGEMTGQGLYGYLEESGMGIEDVVDYRFPEINPKSFEIEFYRDNVVPGVDPDDAPSVPVEADTKPGDLYILGDHRLLCGDATKVDDFKKLMGDQQAHMIWTDPPYNVAYVGKTKDALTIENDSMTDTDFYKFLYDMYTNLLMHTIPGSAIYVAHADTEGVNFRKALKDAGWLLKQCLVWVKNSLVMGRQDYHWKHEPILYGWAPGASHNWYTDRKQTTVVEFDRPTRSTDHPTMKPVGLVEYFINNSSRHNDIILDCFGGSGTTLIAAHKNNRKAYLMEMDPKYCDVIVKRYEAYSGQKAVLEGVDNPSE